jgi:hypothetical protein
VKQGGNNKKGASEFTGDKGSFSVGFLETQLNDFTNGCSTFTALIKVVQKITICL